MENSLRLTLEVVIARAIELADKRGDFTPKKYARGHKNVTQNAPVGTKKRSKKALHPTKTSAIFRPVRNYFKRHGLWTKVLEDLALDDLGELFARKLGIYYRGLAIMDQFTLPGFDHLPKTIQVGRKPLSIGQAKVSEFLAYEAKYQTRSQRNQGRADELHRLAEKLKPLAESNLTVSEACFPPAHVLIMTRKNG